MALRGLWLVVRGRILFFVLQAASAFNSGVNDLRLRAALDDFFMNTSIMTRKGWEVSTESGQAQTASDRRERARGAPRRFTLDAAEQALRGSRSALDRLVRYAVVRM